MTGRATGKVTDLTAAVHDPRQLLGRWLLRRRLIDRRAGRGGSVTGVLDVVEHGTGLRWAEQGELRWGALRTPVRRTTVLSPEPDGWWMHFADGRPFHPWRPGEWVEHPCAADLYRGYVRLALAEPVAERMWVVWDVQGPAKDQRIFTEFVRPPGLGTGTPRPGDDRA